MQFSLRFLCFIISLLQFQLAVLAKVRGVPGVDFPNYSSIPKTSFKCPKEQNKAGFYADFETRCQVFHYCYEHRKESFLCPEGTTFNEAIKSCDYWYSSECDSTQTGERKLEKNSYNDVPLVPVKVQTNNIFDKMAALYEPKEHMENSMYKEQETVDTDEYFEDSTRNDNEKYETDSSDTNSLRSQETLLNKLSENKETGEHIRDFVKYQHDTIEGDGVDIVFYDRLVKPSLYTNDNDEDDMSNIGLLSETETDRYEQQGTTDEEKETHRTYNSEDQVELFTSNLVPSESLVKRLSDPLNTPRKRRFRRKPTYVVLQTTQELDGSSAESAQYGVEENQPILDKTNVYHSLRTESPTSDTTEAENKFEDDFVQMSVRKLRRNRKTLGIQTDKLDQPFHTESSISDITNTENKPEEEIKISVQKPRRNRKTFGMFIEESDKINGETTELAEKYQTSKDETIVSHTLHTQPPMLDTTKTENISEDNKISVKKHRKSLGMLIDEQNKVNNESIKPNKDSIMPANIMSPSFEIEAEPIIFVSEHGTAISSDTLMTAQTTSTQEAVVITTSAPNSITTLEFAENELHEKGDEMENLSDKEESSFNFHKLKYADTDVMTHKPYIYETESTDGFEKDMQNQNFISTLNLNSEIEDQTYLKQEMNHDIVNMSTDIKDMTYLEQEMNRGILNTNSDTEDLTYLGQEMNTGIVNMNSYLEDMAYSEHEINLGSIINMNSNIKDTEYSEQEINPDDSVNMNSEVEDILYSEKDIPTGDIVTNIMNGHSLEVLSTGEQVDQYDDQNKYETIDSMFSQSIKEDYNYKYVLISTLSPMTITDDSSSVNILDEDNDEHISMYENPDSFEDENMSDVEYEHSLYSNKVDEENSEHELHSSLSPLTTTDDTLSVNVVDKDNDEHTSMYENPDSFEDEQMSDVEYEHIPHSENVKEENSEHELASDMDTDISDLFVEDEVKTFADNKNDDFDSKYSQENLKTTFDTKTTSLRDIHSNSVVEYIELSGLEESEDLYTNKNFPLEETTLLQKKPQVFFNSEFSSPFTPPKDWNKGKREPFVETLKESFESTSVADDSNQRYNVDSAPFAKISEEAFKSSAVIEDDTHAEENAPFTKILKEPFGNSIFMEGLKNRYTDKNRKSVKISEEPFESFTVIEDSNDTHIDEKVPFAEVNDKNLGAHNYSPANNKLQNEIFEERDNSITHAKTSKATLLETKLYNEMADSNDLISHHVNDKGGTLDESVLDQFEVNPINTYKATLSQSAYVEKPLTEEEKPIDSVFHSSSMPLPANSFEQGLYKQSLRHEKNVQPNKDKVYPITFYKELDGSFENAKTRKFSVGNIPKTKKYRTLNSPFALDEMNSENEGDGSSKYREPSILSLLEPSETAKRLLSMDFPGLKSGSIFSPSVKLSKPINIKKLVSFGKNLLALKRAKINDFKLLFNSFMNES